MVDIDFFGEPQIAPASWRLKVHGSSNYSLTYDELTGMPLVRQAQTLECISNPVGGGLISTAIWEGVPLAHLLSKAGVPADSVEVRFDCADGYSDSLPLASALDPRTLVAVTMNGAKLTAAHGFPARILTPGRYGMKNPKFLQAISTTSRPFRGYWETRGWSKSAWVRITSRIDYPGSGSVLLHTGPVAVRGIAYAGDRGISRVELSTDGGGSWLPVHLVPPPSALTWVLWTFLWTQPTRGMHTLIVRAFDVMGRPQVAASEATFPNGAEAFDSVQIQIV